MEWETIAPAECPVCGKPSQRGVKLAPFCCTAHRNKYNKHMNRSSDPFWCKAGDHVEYEGLVHEIREGSDYYEDRSIACCGTRCSTIKKSEGIVTCLLCLVDR
jgi:hypothetical protein